MGKCKYFDDLQLFRAFYSYLPKSRGTTTVFFPNWNSIEFISAGKALIGINDDYFDLNAPGLFWIPSGVKYSYKSLIDKSSRLEHFCIDMTGPRSDKMIKALEEICPKHFLRPDNPKQFHEIFENIIKYYRIDKAGNHFRMVVEVERIVALICETIDFRLDKTADAFGINKTATQIRVNPFQKFDFPAIAAENGISYDYFRKLFKAGFGIPVYTYMRSQKMLRVAEMLNSRKLRIKEIADIAGFDDLPTFSRLFKKYFGVSPKFYLKK